MLNGSVELFIQYQSNCIFYMNLMTPDATPPMDIQMISGFLSAGELFFTDLGLAEIAPLFRILRGNHELRMWLGSDLHGTLLLSNLSNLDFVAYHELDELLKSILNLFQEKYLNHIEDLLSTGHFKFPGLRDFILEEVNRMKMHMYTSYLQQILGNAINRNVFSKKSQEFLMSINEVYSENMSDLAKVRKHTDMIRKELVEYLKDHVSLWKIITKINKDYYQIWDLFKVPMIQLPNQNSGTQKMSKKSTSRRS